MLDSLHDPLTRFYDPVQAKTVIDARSGKFYGPGLLVTVKKVKQGEISEEQLIVLCPLPGSPAKKAGIQNGDVITEIDGKAILPYDPFQHIDKLVKDAKNGLIDEDKLRKLVTVETNKIKDGIAFQKAMDMLASKDTKELTLTVARPGVEKPLKIKMTSAETMVDPISVSTPKPTIGLIRVNLVVSSTESKFADALADLQKQGITELILDLRDSPGGDIKSAEAIAGNLIPKKALAVLELPRGKKETVMAEGARGEPWKGKIVVLVNSGTSGVSEVLAAGIRDAAGAELIGSKTSGNNLQQTFMELKDGSAVSMTTGKYLTPKGTDYHDKGLVPDIVIAGGGSASGDDAQLSKAVEILTSGKGKG
jgi:carboxyl-terminal processing protease